MRKVKCFLSIHVSPLSIFISLLWATMFYLFYILPEQLHATQENMNRESSFSPLFLFQRYEVICSFILSSFTHVQCSIWLYISPLMGFLISYIKNINTMNIHHTDHLIHMQVSAGYIHSSGIARSKGICL